jgi:hypothetical protein
MSEEKPQNGAEQEEDFALLVQFPDQRTGVGPAGLFGGNKEKNKEASAKAIRYAMNTVQAMARDMAAAFNALEEAARPDEAEVEFGINLESKVGAWIAEASTGAQLTVTLKWNIEQPNKPKILVDDA